MVTRHIMPSGGSPCTEYEFPSLEEDMVLALAGRVKKKSRTPWCFVDLRRHAVCDDAVGRSRNAVRHEFHNPSHLPANPRNGVAREDFTMATNNSGISNRQIPIVCPGHTRPLAELQFLHVKDENRTFLVSACHGEYRRI